MFSGMQIDTDFGKIQLTLKNNDEKKIPMQSEKSGQDIFHIPDFKILSKKEISSMVFEVHIVQSLQLKIHIPSRYLSIYFINAYNYFIKVEKK